MANIRLKKKYASITDACVGKNAPFATLAQLACFCAMHAFNKSITIPTSRTTGGQEVRDDVLETSTYADQIGMLALAHTKEPNILLEEEDSKIKRYKILEDYANAGLELLKEKKDKNALDINGMDTVLGILREQTKDNLNESLGTGIARGRF
tara:strand:- start:2471 stop:2926 length:456 start_codon:yes stop_codon:yes gene_type:complete